MARKSSCLAALFVLGMAAAASPAGAAPRSINDCEKIQAADAYNQCLASFGPVAHQHNLRSTVPPGAGSVPELAGRRFRQRLRPHPHAATRRPESHGGRQRMEFTISPRRSR